MEQRTVIGLAALGLVGGLVYLQKQSSAGQSASAADLGQQSNGNILGAIFNAISGAPTAAKLQAVSVPTLDAAPLAPVHSVTPAAAPFVDSSQQVMTHSVASSVKTDSLGFAVTGPTLWETKSASINAFVNATGVADADSVQKIATWARDNDYNLADVAAATGYNRQDVSAVFSKAGVAF